MVAGSKRTELVRLYAYALKRSVCCSRMWNDLFTPRSTPKKPWPRKLLRIPDSPGYGRRKKSAAADGSFPTRNAKGSPCRPNAGLVIKVRCCGGAAVPDSSTLPESWKFVFHVPPPGILNGKPLVQR